MRACPSRKKLLILDIMRPSADARLGVLTNDVANSVHAILRDEEKDLPFLVLSPCSAGQVAQVSEELGLSVFAYYLDQGLHGHADADHNQRVTVKELADFVKARVDRWVWQNRGLRQEPKLYGQGDDFVLVQLGRDETSPEKEIPAELKYPEWLFNGWALRDAWARAETVLPGPTLVRRLESTLLRAERRWRGGIEEDRLDREFRNRTPRDITVLDQR